MSQNGHFMRLYSRGVITNPGKLRKYHPIACKNERRSGSRRIKMFGKRCLIKSDSLEFVLEIENTLSSQQISYEEGVKTWKLTEQAPCYSIYIHKNDMEQAEELVREIKRGLWIRNVRKCSLC